MKMQTALYLFLMMVVFCACTPEPLDIDVPQAKRQPVLATQYAFDTISNQSAFVVSLTRTLSVTTDAAPKIDSNGININPDYFIGGAIITLTTTGGTYMLEEIENGIYAAFDIVFNAGELCELIATDADGNLIVSSQTITMPLKELSNLEMVENQNQNQLKYQLTDEVNKQNWYVVNYFTNQQNDTTTKFNDPNYIARRLTEQRLDFDLYSDADFNNGVLNVSKNVPPMGFDTMAVAISEITQGYFNFLTVQKRYGKLINQLKGEALSFPTNVNQGLGYFTLNQPKLYILPLP